MPLLLIRHCESTGPIDDALTPKGQADAMRLAPPLKALGVDAVYSSPYRRAVSTVAPLAALLGVQIQIDARLRERESHTFEALEDFHAHIRRCIADPSTKRDGEETFAEVLSRGLAALSEIASAKHSLPAIACHGQILTAVLRSADPRFGFEQWRAMTTPAVFLVEWRDGGIVGFKTILKERANRRE